MGREIINQSTAARIRGVSRQRISELYYKGRFTTPVDENGNQVKGAIYRDELENLEDGKRGRPPLTKSQRAERGLDRFKLGDRVIWEHKPRDGYEFRLKIIGTVEKIGNIKVLLKFKNGDGEEVTAWAYQDVCNKLESGVKNG